VATSSKTTSEPELSTLSECEAAFRRLFQETSAPFDLTFHSVDGCHHRIRWSKDDIEVEWIHGREPFSVEERRVIGQLAIPMRPRENNSSFTSGSDLVTVPRSDNRTLDRRFVSLAKAAGSLLPGDLFCNWSNVVGEMNSKPESIWFAMLFSEHADPLAYDVNGEIRFHKEVTLYKPIDASIQMAAGIIMQEQTKSGSNAQAATSENRRTENRSRDHRAKPRGRPRVIENSCLEKQILSAWKRGAHKTYVACDNALGISEGTTKATVDRVRKRKKRSSGDSKQ
jgi:hypothetical protein